MQILSYAPAYIIPLLTSLTGIYVLTRILTPDQYGWYALAVSLMALCQSALFGWLDLGAKRFYERALSEGRLPVLAATVYLGLGFSTAVLGVACLVGFGLLQLDHGLVILLAIGAAATFVREASVLSKTFQLAALARNRYVFMECGESVLALVAGLALCWYAGLGAAGMLCGMLVGAAAVVASDAVQIVRRLRGAVVDLLLQRDIVRFATPISLSFSAEYVVASADRLLVEYFLGSAALGVYAVSYSMADRAVTAVFLAISVAAYPLVIRAFEREGGEGARRQALENAELMMTFAVPAWGGFTLASGYIAHVMAGPAFAPSAARLMPIIAAAVFLNAVRAHYVAHAMHLTKRTWEILVASVPAAIINVVLNIVLLPRAGLMGAAWASLIAYAVALAISMWQAHVYFPLPFPVRETGKALAATVVMCVALRLLAFPQTGLGLVCLVVAGAAIYAVLVAAIDIGRLRSRALAALDRGFRQSRPAVPTEP